MCMSTMMTMSMRMITVSDSDLRWIQPNDSDDNACWLFKTKWTRPPVCASSPLIIITITPPPWSTTSPSSYRRNQRYRSSHQQRHSRIFINNIWIIDHQQSHYHAQTTTNLQHGWSMPIRGIALCRKVIAHIHMHGSLAQRVSGDHPLYLHERRWHQALFSSREYRCV